jgi:uncharacterized caspase-like protein
MRHAAALCFIVALCLLSATHRGEAATKRVALVIGNSAYVHAPPLPNPRNDAADVAKALKSFGFKVIEAFDLDKAGMDRTILEFARALGGADAGLFFYAGHGLQVGAQNYLVPIDAKLTETSGLDFETVRLDLVQRTMERETQSSILFLDACRNNPLARNLARAMGTRSVTIGRGLASVEAGVVTLVSFSTQPGNVAEDGTGRNSPFAGALLKQLSQQTSKTRDDLSTLLIGVRNDVITTTKRAQVPWEHSALTAKFYFPETSPEPVAPAGPTHGQQEELAFWNAAKDMNEAAGVEMYLSQYPNGKFAGLAKVLLAKLKREADQKLAVAASEIELRARDEAQREAVARQAETERRAAQVKQADALKKSEDDAAKATAALATAERDREAARQTAEAAKAALAATQSERLAIAEPSSEISRDVLIRKLQAELVRVGCEPGAVDGKWGASGRSALERFAKFAKVKLDPAQPNDAVLEALTSRRSRVCPLVCDDEEEEKGGKCVRKAVTKTPTPVAKVAPSTIEKPLKAPEQKPATVKNSTSDLPKCSGSVLRPGDKCISDEGQICLNWSTASNPVRRITCN